VQRRAVRDPINFTLTQSHGPSLSGFNPARGLQTDSRPINRFVLALACASTFAAFFSSQRFISAIDAGLGLPFAARDSGRDWALD